MNFLIFWVMIFVLSIVLFLESIKGMSFGVNENKDSWTKFCIGLFVVSVIATITSLYQVYTHV